MIFCLFTILGCLSVIVNSHSRGSPKFTCLVPYPHHDTKRHTLSPQPHDKMPYIVSVEPNIYSENSILNITISTPNNYKIEGLLITVKPKTYDIVNPVGSFLKTQYEDIKFYNFSSGINSCLSHSSNARKPQFMHFLFKSPEKNLGTLILSSVIVKGKKTFWINIEREIRYEGSSSVVPVENPTRRLSQNDVIPPSQCGVTKNCLLFPKWCLKTNNCEFLLKYSANKDFVDFQLIGPDVAYIALGLSNDTKMKDDFVVACSLIPNSKRVIVQTGYTVEGKHKYLVTTLDQQVINKKAAKLKALSDKDSIVCKFQIPKTRMNSNIHSFPTNLSNPLYIFIAYGNTYPNTTFVKKHDFQPLVSLSPIILYSEKNNILQYFQGLSTYKQLHGTIMSIAFIIFQSTATVIALHFRNNLNYKIKNIRLWFYVHVGCNLSCMVLGLIGYFYILIMKRFKFNKSEFHGSFGTITMILTSLNIISGFTRPDINHRKRWIFNLLHFLNSVTIRIFVFLTLWSVYFQYNLTTHFKLWWFAAMILWTTGQILLSIFVWLLTRRKFQSFEQTNPREKIYTDEVKLRNWILYLYLGFLFISVTNFISGIWIN